MGTVVSRFVAALAVCATLVASGGSGSEVWQRGVELYAAEGFREAQEQFERAIVLESGNSKYHLWLGLAIGRRAEQMTGLRRIKAMPLAKESRRHFERAVDLDGSNLKALEALQGFHFRAPGIVGGNKDEARNLARRIEEVDAARGAAAWAMYHEHMKNFEDSERHHQRARHLDPDEIGYLLRHASFLSRQDRITESDQLFEEALSREPDNPDVWLNAASAWIAARRRSHYGRARHLLERYLAAPDRKPDSEPASMVRKLVAKL